MLLLFVALFSLVSADCPKGWKLEVNSNVCYLFANTDSLFQEAEDTCVGYGGHMASIGDEITNSFIIENSQIVFGKDQDVWIGGERASLSAPFTWTDGTPFNFTDWEQASGKSQQPNNGTKSLCVGLDPMPVHGHWFAGDCLYEFPFVCALPNAGISKCCPSGWTFFDKTSACYQVQHSYSFSGAESACVDAGGHLASIHSNEENEFVANLAGTSRPTDATGQTWIGLQKVGNLWAWTDNSTVDFIRWNAKQPSGTATCAQLMSDDLTGTSGLHYGWQTIDCATSLRAFVCKQTLS